MLGKGGVTHLSAPRRAGLLCRRLAILLVAVVACAWYILQIRELNERERVTAFVDQHTRITEAQAKAADATLANAQFLNPDQLVRSLRAVVATKAGDRSRAIAIAEAIVRREPLNYGTWEFVAYLFAGTDSRTLRVAQAHIRMLVPSVPPPR